MIRRLRYIIRQVEILSNKLPATAFEASLGCMTVTAYANLAEEKKISIRKFRFEECTHDFLLEYMMYFKDKGCAAGTCNNRLAAIRSYLWYVADGEI